MMSLTLLYKTAKMHLTLLQKRNKTMNIQQAFSIQIHIHYTVQVQIEREIQIQIQVQIEIHEFVSASLLHSVPPAFLSPQDLDWQTGELHQVIICIESQRNLKNDNLGQIEMSNDKIC